MCENVKLATTEKWRSYVVSEPTYCTKKIFTENLLLIEMKKNRNNLWIVEVSVVEFSIVELSVVELSKVIMHEFCYEYVKQKYEEKAKLWYMDIDRFIA